MDTILAADLKDLPGPKYRRVADIIRREIADGRLNEGAKLPPVRELAYRMGITPGTVARAYTILTDDGLLVGEVGRGTFVARKARREVAEDLPEDPVEVDVIRHGTTPQDSDKVNMFSPYVPNVGQAALIRNLLAGLAEDPPSGLMHYPSRASSRAARQAAVPWLARAPIGPVSAEDVVLTHGGQNAISLILQALMKGRRPAILVEELSYPGFRRAAEMLRADVVPVAMDGDGVRPDALETAARGQDAQVFCTTPQVHNPTLITTPLARRRELAEIARRHDLQILEDDCYRLSEADLPSYRMLAPERSWYVASISKSLTPALRVGFGVAPEGRAPILRRAAEYGYFGLSAPVSDLAAALLSHPELASLETAVRTVLSQYVHSAVNILGGHDLAWRAEIGFLWLTLPRGWRAGAFCRAAENEGVQIRAAEDFAGRNALSPHAVRLAVNAGLALPAWEDALMRLRRLLDDPPERIGV